MLCPAYISEVTPARSRGKLASLQQVMIIIGLTGAFLANYVLAKVAGGSTGTLWLGYPAWRWMFWMQVIPAAIFLIMLLIIPESPRFLVSRGRLAKAETVLARIFGAAEAQAQGAGDFPVIGRGSPPAQALGSVGQCWQGPPHRVGRHRSCRFPAAGGHQRQCSTTAPCCGNRSASASPDSLLINVVSGVLSIGACIFTIFTVDRIGRKPLLIVGSIGMAITLGSVAAAFSTGSLVNGTLQLSHPAGLVALISANLYVIFFNLSWGPVMWILLGEMFPNQIRGSGLAVAGFAQWIANYGITVSFPIMAANLGLVITYGFYAASALVSFFFVRAMVHETKGMELEHMTG